MIEGLHVVRKVKPGKPVRWYVYAYRGGPQIAARVGGSRPKLTDDEIDEYRRVMERKRPSHTIAGLIQDYRAPDCEEWKALADSTRIEWNRALDAIEAKWGTVPLVVFSDWRIREKIIAWRDDLAKPGRNEKGRKTGGKRKADYFIGVLVALLQWGLNRARVAANHAADIPRLYKGGNRANIIWTREDHAKLLALAPQQVADAANLARLTGLRRGDLVEVDFASVGEFNIVWRTSKSGQERIVTVPILPELKALIEELRTRQRKDGVNTLLVNSHGKPWTENGLDTSFSDVRDAAGIVDDLGRPKRLHDYRGSFATELMIEWELTDEQVGNIVGWSPQAVAELRRLYVDQSRIVVAIGERMAKRAVNRPVNQSGEASAK